jgi:site-specific recombinase XerD
LSHVRSSSIRNEEVEELEEDEEDEEDKEDEDSLGLRTKTMFGMLFATKASTPLSIVLDF